MRSYLTAVALVLFASRCGKLRRSETIGSLRYLLFLSFQMLLELHIVLCVQYCTDSIAGKLPKCTSKKSKRLLASALNMRKHLGNYNQVVKIRFLCSQFYPHSGVKRCNFECPSLLVPRPALQMGNLQRLHNVVHCVQKFRKSSLDRNHLTMKKGKIILNDTRRSLTALSLSNLRCSSSVRLIETERTKV